MVNSRSQKRAVERFLSTGQVGRLSPEELAEVCNERVRLETQVSSDSSVKMARLFVRRARPVGGVLYLTALRASGFVYAYASKYKEAETAYLKARSLAGGDAMLRARIDRMLIDVYMYLGQNEEAKRRARLALSTFARLNSPEQTATTRINYGNLLHRQDRHREARRVYTQAADYFQTHNMELLLALSWFNLGNTCVQLCDFAAAERYYSGARKTWKKHGYQLNAIDCLFGSAWLHRLRGDFHVALRELTECETHYAGANQVREVVLCQLDRADAYLSLNLIPDALEIAEQAGKNARKLGIKYEAAKADLFKGKSLVALGRSALARKALERAEKGFAEENNIGYLAATQLALAQVETQARKKLSLMRAARRKFARAQFPLWEAVCDLQIIADWPEEVSVLRRLAKNKAVKSVPYLTAHHHTILGDRRARKQHLKAAIAHWTKAADILDALRAKLPPLEMRSSFFSTRSKPHRRLIQAEFERSPLRAAIWSERHKTAGLWSTSDDFFQTNPTRARIQESLTQLAQYFLSVSKTISNSGDKRTATVRTPSALRKIQREIRNNLIKLEQSSSADTNGDGIGTLIKSISRVQPVVQFHVGDDDLLAFVHQDGDTKAVRYSNGRGILDSFMARWRFLVECAPAPTKRTPRSYIDDERQVLGRIASWLLPPLELADNTRRLLVIPEGQLSSLPWTGLPINGSVMGERYRLTFVPSLRHHIHARQQKTKSRKVKLFVGNAAGLPHLRHEVTSVSSRLGITAENIHNPCRRANWPDHSQARIWHYAGHAHLRSDNPFYSSLLLDDGPLFAADFRLKRNKVGLVVLAACRTGQQTSLPGEEASGLVRSLLEMGAANVVASGWAVSDRSTSLWMDIFYDTYLNGLSSSQAVQQASLKVRESFPLTCHWGSFAVHGEG